MFDGSVFYPRIVSLTAKIHFKSQKKSNENDLRKSLNLSDSREVDMIFSEECKL